MLSGEEILNLYSFSPNTDRLWVADFVLLLPPPSFVWLKPWSQWSFSSPITVTKLCCIPTPRLSLGSVISSDKQTFSVDFCGYKKLLQKQEKGEFWDYWRAETGASKCYGWLIKESRYQNDLGRHDLMFPPFKSSGCDLRCDWNSLSCCLLGLVCWGPKSASTLALWHPDQDSLVLDQLGAWLHQAGLIQPQGKETVTD